MIIHSFIFLGDCKQQGVKTFARSVFEKETIHSFGTFWVFRAPLTLPNSDRALLKNRNKSAE